MLKGLGDIGQLMKMQKEMKNIQKNIPYGKEPSRVGKIEAIIYRQPWVYALCSILVNRPLVDTEF